MSSVVVITSLIVILAALVCYAFVTQTLAHRKQHRERLLGVLTAKVRNFRYMLNGFPQGFLPKDLTLLVQRSLIDLYEQLVDLDPGNNLYRQDLQSLSQQLNDTQRQARQQNPVSIENPQQIKEAKTCLEELHKFVFQLEAKGVVNRTNAEAYRGMIKQLVLQITVDSYLLSGRHAKSGGKVRLAIHYFSLAHKLLVKEGKNGQFDKKIAALQLTIQELEQHLIEEEPTAIVQKVAPEEEKAGEAQWNQFQSGDQSWKKKQVYD
jgi:hypothetical protein